MTKKKRPARSDAAQRAERRAPIERAMRELEALEGALKKYSEQARSLWLAREAFLADTQQKGLRTLNFS